MTGLSQFQLKDIPSRISICINLINTNSTKSYKMPQARTYT